MTERIEEIKKRLMEMPEDWRGYWCQSDACACMGGANCSGGLLKAGFTHTEWVLACGELGIRRWGDRGVYAQ